MRRLLLLSAAAVAVWVLAVWLPGEAPENQSPESMPVGPEGATDRAGWIDFSDGAVDRVVLAGPAGEIELYKEDGEWFVDSPERGPVRAARGKAEALTAFLRGHPPLRRLDTEGEDLARYGLDNATRGISVFADGDAFTLMLGDLNPTGDGVYGVAQGPTPVSGQVDFEPTAGDVLVLDTEYVSRLSGGADRFYDLRALDMNRKALASMRLEGPEDATRGVRWEIAFDQDNATRASFTWPESLKNKPVSHMEADSYATRLLGLQGAGYYEPADEATVEQEPAFAIYVQRRGADSPERLAFSIRRPEGADPMDAGNATFVLESDWQTQPLVVAARDVDALLRTAFSLRQRGITYFAAHQVQRIEAEYVEPGAGLRNATAVYEDGGWKLREPEDGRELPELGMTVWRMAELAYVDEPRELLPADASRSLTVRLYGEGLDEAGLEMAWYDIPYGVGAFVAVDGEDGPYYPVGEGGRRIADALIDQLFVEAGPDETGDAPEPAANASATSPEGA